MRQIILSVFVAVMASTSVSAHKSTTPYNDCILALDNLIAITSSVSSLADKEQAGLIKITSDARNLLSIGKTSDALNKLFNYQTKLDQLAATLINPKPKISVSDEQTLRTALNEAIACVSGA